MWKTFWNFSIPAWSCPLFQFSSSFPKRNFVWDKEMKGFILLAKGFTKPACAFAVRLRVTVWRRIAWQQRRQQPCYLFIHGNLGFGLDPGRGRSRPPALRRGYRVSVLSAAVSSDVPMRNSLKEFTSRASGGSRSLSLEKACMPAQIVHTCLVLGLIYAFLPSPDLACSFDQQPLGSCKDTFIKKPCEQVQGTE